MRHCWKRPTRTRALRRFWPVRCRCPSRAGPRERTIAMRHRKRTAKLGMKSQHRRSTLANLVCSLIEYSRITTTVAKAKVARRYADKMVTLAKKGTLHHRREALAFLRHKPAVVKLFAEIGKQHGDRNGGYTRIVRVG